MANNFDKIVYEEQSYYPRDTRSYLVVGTQQGATHLWKGVMPEGVDRYPTVDDDWDLTIDYYLPTAGTSTKAKLDLSNLGAKYVYKSHGNDYVTTEFEAGSVIRLAYIPTLDSNNGGWKVVGSDASGSSSGGRIHVEYDESVGSASSWNAGSATVIETEDIEADKITNWSTGTMTNISVIQGVLTIQNGTEPTLSTLDPRPVVKSVKTNTAGVAPSLTITNKKLVKDVTQDED